MTASLITPLPHVEHDTPSGGRVGALLGLLRDGLDRAPVTRRRRAAARIRARYLASVRVQAQYLAGLPAPPSVEPSRRRSRGHLRLVT